MNDETEVRRTVAAQFGLGWQEAEFLAGDTLPELEENAKRLAELLGRQREPEPEPAPIDIISIARAQTAARKKMFMDALVGRLPQARDQAGRFTASSAGFDGGARPAPPLPPETHEEMLTRVLQTGQSDVGRRL